MTDLKRGARDLEDDAKEALRRADGEESLGDKLANVGDRLRHGAENVGDELREKGDDVKAEMDYQHGRSDERRDDPDLHR